MTTIPRPPVRRLHLDVHARPFLVIWELTRACALACRHCRADAIHDRHPGELTTDEGRALIADLAAYGPPRPILVLTGGDPFERHDLQLLIRHASEQSLTVALAPSVTPKLSASALRELRDVGTSAVSLSLDGATAAVHDGLRGVAGVWAETLTAARTVRAVGIRLQVNTTVTAANVEDLPGILHHVVDLDTGLWSIFFLVPTGRGTSLEPLRADAVEEVLHWLYDVADRVPIKTTEAPQYRRVVLQRSAQPTAAGQTAGPLHASLRERSSALLAEIGDPSPRQLLRRPPLDVNAGRGFVFVDHLGAVYPSGFLPLPVGSVREQPLSAIYRDAPLLQALRDPKRFAGRCGRCEFGDVCGGSRSRAYVDSGDPLGEDPACVWQPASGSASLRGPRSAT